MAEVKFNKTQLFEYLAQNNVQMNDELKTNINSIFDECDTNDENGQVGSDGILSRDEVKSFIERIGKELKNLYLNITDFYSKLARVQASTEQVECKLTKEEQELYKQNLQLAKEICNNNKELLGLTDVELALINNSDIVSESYGAARFDKLSNQLLFNINSKGDTSIGSLVKVLIHEATHATINSQYNSQEEERQCETRALVKSYELFKQGKIDDFEIISGSNIYISQLDSENKISDFVEEWLRRGYSNLPEN